MLLVVRSSDYVLGVEWCLEQEKQQCFSELPQNIAVCSYAEADPRFLLIRLLSKISEISLWMWVSHLGSWRYVLQWASSLKMSWALNGGDQQLHQLAIWKFTITLEHFLKFSMTKVIKKQRIHDKGKVYWKSIVNKIFFFFKCSVTS